ncbi:MAG: membrane dipeptidase [Clostridia bacterium]|nr:membrane dipeptidase [Clostridia bacterium]
MKYFDLHCDTLPIVMEEGKSLTHSQMMVDLSNLPFDQYVQVLAVFSYPSLSADEAYELFWSSRRHLDTLSDLPECFRYILAVENGSLIGDHIERVDELAKAGVRLMNPVWAGDNLIGGAWNTDRGLTSFGKEVICRAFDLGITPDLSHASDPMAKEILEIAAQKGKPVIASHSCARALQNLGRNLPDEYFREIARSGGIVGLSFCPPHLSDGECNMETIRRHLEHYLALDGENVIAIGADWDGIDTTPDGVEAIRDIPALADHLRQNGWSELLLHKLFYQNAADFFARQNISF